LVSPQSTWSNTNNAPPPGHLLDSHNPLPMAWYGGNSGKSGKSGLIIDSISVLLPDNNPAGNNRPSRRVLSDSNSTTTTGQIECATSPSNKYLHWCTHDRCQPTNQRRFLIHRYPPTPSFHFIPIHSTTRYLLLPPEIPQDSALRKITLVPYATGIRVRHSLPGGGGASRDCPTPVTSLGGKLSCPTEVVMSFSL